jgi:hypothetical protein
LQYDKFINGSGSSVRENFNWADFSAENPRTKDNIVRHVISVGYRPAVTPLIAAKAGNTKTEEGKRMC